MQGIQQFWRDVTHIPAFEDRTVPCLAARQTVIDQPCVKLSPIRIEPGLIAASEWPQGATSTACDPGLGFCFRNKGPADLKFFAHTVLVFRSEVHQGGCVRMPLELIYPRVLPVRRNHLYGKAREHGVAMFGGGGNCDSGTAHGTSNDARPVSCHHLMNTIMGRQACTSRPGVKLE